MINNKSVIRALPILASILGKKYGVQVEIGGEKAFTDGRVIYLPALPLEADDVVLNLVRGFIDHESAHVRDTDFDVLTSKDVSPLIKHVWNILEDWRVENSLAEIFPGCRANFDWLIERHFGKAIPKSKNPAMLILNYILYCVRSWDSDKIAKNRDIIGKYVEHKYPNLFSGIKNLLEKAKGDCKSSADCMAYARKIVKLIENESIKLDSEENDGAKSNSEKGKSNKKGEKKASSESQNENDLKELLNASDSDLPCDIGESIAGQLKGMTRDPSGVFTVATTAPKILHAMPDYELSQTRRASTALRARLQSLLQSSILKRSAPGRYGKLDTKGLFKLGYSHKIFLKNEEKQGVSTAVHVLLDCSGSMRNRMDFACQACYAIAESLDKINGISVGVTAFPSDPIVGDKSPNPVRTTVSSVLKHGQNMHTNFKLKSSGSTPMGEAIWRVMQDVYFLKENRKIILILTDGKPDYVQNAKKAIEAGTGLDFEFYGIGIEDENILQLLPKNSQVIKSIEDLTPAMFNLLQTALLKA